LEEYWYALECKAPLISMSTNFLQPSQFLDTIGNNSMISMVPSIV